MIRWAWAVCLSILHNYQVDCPHPKKYLSGGRYENELIKHNMNLKLN